MRKAPAGASSEPKCGLTLSLTCAKRIAAQYKHNSLRLCICVTLMADINVPL